VPPPPPRPAVEKRDALLLAAAYHVRHRHKLSFPAILARVTTEGMRGRVRVEPLSGPAWNLTRLQIEGCSRAGTARRTPPACANHSFCRSPSKWTDRTGLPSSNPVTIAVPMWSPLAGRCLE
jgi:hypothetical protein